MESNHGGKARQVGAAVAYTFPHCSARRLPVGRRSRASQTGESDQREDHQPSPVNTSLLLLWQVGWLLLLWQVGWEGASQPYSLEEKRYGMEWLQLHGQCGTGPTMD